MAQVLGHFSLQILDDLGVTASAPYYMEFDDTSTLAELDTAVQAYVTNLDAVTDGQILGVSLITQVSLPGGIKSAPVAGAEVERGGLFNFSQVGLKYKFGVLVPAFKKAAIVDGKIDLSNADVTDFISDFLAVGGDATAVSTAGKVLGLLRDALLVFRKHRKAENRRSFEVGT